MSRIDRMNQRGVTLIELMIALVISGAIVAGIYRTFLTQQHAYEVQEDVMDMQQNVRAALNEMTREIRMAGFGNIQSILPVTINGTTYNNIINPDTPVAGALTMLSGIGGSVTLTKVNPPNIITVSSLNSDTGKLLFEAPPADKRIYLSIGGSESFAITGVAGKTLTLNRNIDTTFKTDGAGNVTVPVSVYAIRAITYVIVPDASGTPVLRRNENLGGGNQPLAEGIENVMFEFFDRDGAVAANPVDIRSIRVTATAITKNVDPRMKVGDGRRRKQVVSNVLLRNMGL